MRGFPRGRSPLDDDFYELPGSDFPRSRDRARAARNASGIRRRDDSANSYKNARSAKANSGRIRSKSSNKYASSSSLRTVGSSAPVDSYRPCPTRLRSPSRTRRVNAKVIAERLASGKAVTSSRAGTGRPADRTYSYTLWMIALVSWSSGDSGPLVNNMILTNGSNLSFSRVHQ